MDLKVKSYSHYKQESKYSLALIFTITSMLVCVMYSISFIAVGAAYAAYGQMLGAFVFMSIAGLLRRRVQRYTRYFAIMTSLILVIVQGIFVFGPTYGFQYQLFPLIVVIFLLLDFNVIYERVSIYFLSVLCIVVFYMIQWSSIQPQFDDYLIYATYYFNIALFFSFMGMLVLLYYLSKEIFAAKDQLYSMATTDALTNLYNRRTFIKRGEEAFKIAERGGHHFSVILYDIDSFKSVNDEYGHLVGDSVLKSIADVSMQSVRETDLIARYGGEEFAILLPNTSPEQAGVVAEKLRERIEKHVMDIVPFKISRTISLGIVGYHFSITSFDELLDKADKAMYRSKSNGKNMVTLFDMTDPFYKR